MRLDIGGGKGSGSSIKSARPPVPFCLGYLGRGEGGGGEEGRGGGRRGKGKRNCVVVFESE